MSLLLRGVGLRPAALPWGAVLAVVLLAACGQPGAPTADRSATPASRSSPSTPGGVAVAVDLERPRYLATRERLEVITVNKGATPVTISDVRLVGGGFVDVPAVARATILRPGQRTDVQVAYGSPRCQPEDAEAPARVALVVDDGVERHQALLPVPATSDVLPRLHAEACFRQRLRATVDLHFGERWATVPGRSAVTGEIRLRRLAGSSAAVAVDDVAGNVIFSLAPVEAGSAPLLDLQPHESAATLPVQVDASRCEPHALAESKKTFSFPLWVSLDGAQPRYVEIEPRGQARAALQALVDACAAETARW